MTAATRAVYYVAHPLRPNEAELARSFGGDPTRTQGAIHANLQRAMRWLSWLRRSFPETTFIAPWIAAVLSRADDTDLTAREAGLLDAFTVLERCDGIVLCGPRVSAGMRVEVEHGRMVAARNSHLLDFEVLDLTLLACDGEPPPQCRGNADESFFAYSIARGCRR